MLLIRIILLYLIFQMVNSERKNYDCKTTRKGASYRGNLASTVSGKTCQSWSVNFPHSHRHGPLSFKDEDFSQVGNKCRNPDSSDMPWCYTTDPKVRWEFCDIPFCQKLDQNCKMTEKGQDYRGTFASTVTGKTCQPWSQNYPQKHEFGLATFYDEDYSQLWNKCRNPDSSAKPWCYTMDPNIRWEYCEIPFCELVNYDCKTTRNGARYRGNIARTVSGRTCQLWSAIFPHHHNLGPSFFRDENFYTLGNKCRNPDNEERPWCYTTDPTVRWEYCDIPFCQQANPECKLTEKGKDYRGSVTSTATGRTCQLWSLQYPQKHGYGPLYFDDEDFSILSNKCRNPDNEDKPWCFTTDPTVRWEYCDIPFCSTVAKRSMNDTTENFKKNR